MSDFYQVQVTFPNREVAERVSGELVGKSLSACSQIAGPVKSIYRWKGAVEEAEEYLVMIKTRKELFERVKELILKMHPYEVPEVIAVTIADGSASYLKWLEDSTSLE
ncbi:MAG: divalent-cation tolerance protein CutA [Thermoplasmatota archaeon]